MLGGAESAVAFLGANVDLSSPWEGTTLIQWYVFYEGDDAKIANKCITAYLRSYIVRLHRSPR